jgi:hypothetical protein
MDEFKAETKTSYEMLCEPNVGFYIPPYQREYSWDKSKVARLFEDAGHGLRLLFEEKGSSDATAFLGTIIVIHDTRYQTVDPKVQGDLPKSVQVVIDGQQRLASIFLSNIYLHDFMVKAARKLKGNADEPHEWLYQQALQIQADFERTFGDDMPYGDDGFRWYPRMIRAYVDSWSRKGDKARYKSPIAACLRAYSSHLKENHAQDGTKLSKRLNEQRVYLRRSYARLELPDRRKFVAHLADAATFVARVWNGVPAAMNPPPLHRDIPQQDLTAMCFKVLRDASHHITVGPLLRFYSAIRSAASDDERTKAIGAFDTAVKAVTAFFALWRGSRRGTKNIDQQYRRLMHDGLPEEPTFARVPPFCREGAAAFPNIDDLRRALRHLLAAEKDTPLAGKEDWVRLAQASPVYESSTHLARFLLFAASEDAAPDPENAGLVKRARPGSAQMLNWVRWTSDLTVEHVWPRSRPKDGWDASLYAELPEMANCLGNLTLIPSSENSSLGNRNPPESKAMSLTAAAMP